MRNTGLSMDKWLEELRSELNKRHMSYGQLGRVSGISNSTICRWFLDERVPSPTSQHLIEEALGLKAEVPTNYDPDAELYRALSRHPDLPFEDAERFWKYIKLVIKDVQRQQWGK